MARGTFFKKRHLRTTRLAVGTARAFEPMPLALEPSSMPHRAAMPSLLERRAGERDRESCSVGSRRDIWAICLCYTVYYTRAHRHRGRSRRDCPIICGLKFGVCGVWRAEQECPLQLRSRRSFSVLSNISFLCARAGGVSVRCGVICGASCFFFVPSRALSNSFCRRAGARCRWR